MRTPAGPAEHGSLAARFEAAGANRVRWEGRLVHRVVPLPVVGPSRLVIHRVTARPDREQVLHLAVSHGQFRLGRRVGRTLRLRASAAPPRIELDVDAPMPAIVRVWSGWVDDGVAGTWSGSAGIVVERAGAAWLLQCSDGIGEATFTDLVVLLQLTARAMPAIDLRPEAAATTA